MPWTFGLSDAPDVFDLLAFLDFIKVNNRWNKFFITPHILAEVCGHLNRDYRKYQNYGKIIEEV